LQAAEEKRVASPLMSSDVTNHADRRTLTFAMGLSLGIGFLMLAIKLGAYLLTGSTAILSDAAESVVHVVAVSFAAYSLRLSHKPADPSHLYGHTKVSFFSAGFEGAMIIIAAIYIIFEAVTKWLGGLHLEHLGLGTVLTAVAMLINGALGAYLLWVGKKKNSLILTANGKHVLTDCWTSLGVIAGLCLALVTGWLPWDPIAAIFVATNILISGIGLIRQSVGGLMDVADPKVHRQLVELLDAETRRHGIRYHSLRHRNVGDAHWVEVHLLFHENVPLGKAHSVATAIEQTVEAALKPGSRVTTHLEALEDHERIHARGQH
jgi:cation diffusion facilitator family transporter